VGLLTLWIIGGSAVMARGQTVHEYCDASKAGESWTLNLAGKAKLRDVISALYNQKKVSNIVPDYDVLDIDVEALSITASWKSILSLIMEQNNLVPICMEGGILRIARRDRLIASDHEQTQLMSSRVRYPRKKILIRIFIYSIPEKVLNILSPEYAALTGASPISGANLATLLEQAQANKILRIITHPFGPVLEEQIVEFRSEPTDGFRMIQVRPELNKDESGNANSVTLHVMIDSDQSLHTTVYIPNQQAVVLGGALKTTPGGLFKKQKSNAVFYAISAEILP
jgi:hypothetical protein